MVQIYANKHTKGERQKVTLAEIITPKKCRNVPCHNGNLLSVYITKEPLEFYQTASLA
jgi:hypothetical protein